ncbi:restriction endonuclease subunit S [Listeria seeligeri]|uniref:restriction endonuclease subunit S n=1 Tax=Listeria seeligeri TaxID=1640 RepID=UPI0016253F82|nr:restriction endonuclease subunit S [Listeria seeligeri]MBC1894590.1 restriction endonuclease subunit S [Listeria seeligeri]MBC1994762.1 restriction endonuclease subunit S [Listeria seeligeri]MBC2221423.1 restriction endonuclease subunit S [Listeria seeligeri]MBF2453030.1 restriction endonuclease subunit S [Listeria seeligeri]MBF2668518.1 restriction endonuclease subunit S [Listeria seeligeri]
MSDSKKKVPKRRFEEFSNANDWEQRKFTDVLDRVNLVSNSNKIPKVEFEDIVAGEGRLNKDISEKLDNRKGTLFHPNSILYGKLRPYLQNWLQPTFKGIALGDFWVFEAKDTDAKFDYFLIQADKYQRIANDTSGTKMPRSDWRLVSNSFFSIPKKEEQQKIGTFFQQLDDTIALHQRKLEKIKALKTAYLSEMFPAEGESKPKRRFAGFTDEWEQRNLMSVFEFPVSTNSLSRSQLNYDNGEIKSVHYGDILVNYDSILEIAKDRIPFITNGVIDKYKPNLLENGDLIFADAAEDETVGKAVEVGGKTNEYIVAGLHTIVARPRRKMAKFFWGYYINSSIYHNQLLRLMQGTKVASISKSNLQKTYVTYPDNFVEQQKIGAFFKQLDNTIALHQRKLKKLQNIKKAYLNEMFI